MSQTALVGIAGARRSGKSAAATILQWIGFRRFCGSTTLPALAYMSVPGALHWRDAMDPRIDELVSGGGAACIDSIDSEADAAWIRAWGGQVIHILHFVTRLDPGPRIVIRAGDRVIDNTGSLDHLCNQLRGLEHRHGYAG